MADIVEYGVNSFFARVHDGFDADLSSLRVVGVDVVEAVTELKSKPGRELQVHGSGDLAQTLIEHDLVDEYRMLVYPVILGRGRRMFGSGIAPIALRLVDTKTTAAGVAAHTYEPEGKPSFGSFALDQ